MLSLALPDEPWMRGGVGGESLSLFLSPASVSPPVEEGQSLCRED